MLVPFTNGSRTRPDLVYVEDASVMSLVQLGPTELQSQDAPRPPKQLNALELPVDPTKTYVHECVSLSRWKDRYTLYRSGRDFECVDLRTAQTHLDGMYEANLVRYKNALSEWKEALDSRTCTRIHLREGTGSLFMDVHQDIIEVARMLTFARSEEAAGHSKAGLEYLQKVILTDQVIANVQRARTPEPEVTP